jgi:hypothetical protein
MKTKQQYRQEALDRVQKLNLSKKPKLNKSRFFSKVSTGGYLVRMIKQVRK